MHTTELWNPPRAAQSRLTGRGVTEKQINNNCCRALNNELTDTAKQVKGHLCLGLYCMECPVLVTLPKQFWPFNKCHQDKQMERNMFVTVGVSSTDQYV